MLKVGEPSSTLLILRPLFLSSHSVAFSLNVAGAYLDAGSLVLSLSGALKVRLIDLCGADKQDILLVASSVLIMGSTITGVPVIGGGKSWGRADRTGYSIALSGFVLYRVTGGSQNSPVGAHIVQLLNAVAGHRESSYTRIC